jgi:hypothetical protein
LALDVTTEARAGFRNEGRVDLRKGVLSDVKDTRYTLHRAMVLGDIVMGPAMARFASSGGYGDIRGWDARRKTPVDIPYRPAPRGAGVGDIAARRLKNHPH